MCIVLNVRHPRRLHGPGSRARLTTNDYPVDAAQVQSCERPQQRFERQESDSRSGTTQVVKAVAIIDERRPMLKMPK